MRDPEREDVTRLHDRQSEVAEKSVRREDKYQGTGVTAERLEEPRDSVESFTLEEMCSEVALAHLDSNP